MKSRLLEHNSGKGAKYTRSRRPVKQVGVSSELTKSQALSLNTKSCNYRRTEKSPS
ncbi:MAG: hypothetical protein V2J65_17860 [Desulfobacteraceae bacterium]|nr:hypothetical protein [Desulfobacteraceae bacterium]